MPRCCTAKVDDLTECYASVLVAPKLEESILELERGRLVTNITTWCKRCKRASLLTGSVKMFKKPSEHHAHMLVLARKANP